MDLTHIYMAVTTDGLCITYIFSDGDDQLYFDILLVGQRDIPTVDELLHIADISAELDGSTYRVTESGIRVAIWTPAKVSIGGAGGQARRWQAGSPQGADIVPAYNCYSFTMNHYGLIVSQPARSIVSPVWPQYIHLNYTNYPSRCELPDYFVITSDGIKPAKWGSLFIGHLKSLLAYGTHALVIPGRALDQQR